MKFHLNHKPKTSSTKIDHQKKVMLVGSCFAENIGEKLKRNHFNALVNPNGILFNPASICNSLMHCIESDKVTSAHLLQRDGMNFSFLHHSSIFNKDSDEFKMGLLRKQKEARDFLKDCQVLILTFGTSYMYWHKERKIAVANCHKQSGETFDKILLSVNDIVDAYTTLLNKLKIFNPNLKLVFTASPVKYFKDGVEENNLSKATLLLAIHELKKKFDVEYFPAYELVNDDLRDYRFYKQDMAHPNDEAINYIWDKFSDAYFTAETKKLNSELHQINSSEDHKILFPESEEARSFKENLKNKKTELSKKHPFIKF